MRVLMQNNSMDAVGATRDDFDLTDRIAIQRFLKHHSPDVVLNTAAMASHAACEADPAAAMLVNATAVKFLAQECTAVGAKLIQISTDAVFDGSLGNYLETDDPSPNTAYGISKLQGEIHAAAENDSLILRTNFFGWSPDSHASILEFFVNTLASGQTAPGYIDTITTSLYTSDLIERIITLSETSGLFHLTSSDSISKFEFGQLVADHMGVDQKRITAVASPEGPKNISLNTLKASDYLANPLPTQAAGLTRAFLERPAIEFPGLARHVQP